MPLTFPSISFKTKAMTSPTKSTKPKQVSLVELVICCAGEPMQWIEEIPPYLDNTHFGVIIYDTGVRNSKHGLDALISHKMGISVHDLENLLQARGVGFSHTPSMMGGRFSQRGPDASKIAKAAAGAVSFREMSDKLMHYAKTAFAVLEDGGLEKKIQRAFKLVKSANDGHMRESAQWQRHIIENFHSLADVTVFSHGWPFDHVPDMVEHVRSAMNCKTWSLLPMFPREAMRDIHEPEIKWQVRKLLDFIGDTRDAQQTNWVIGTEFMATREVLQAPGLEWWQGFNALSQTLGPRSAEALERVYSSVLTMCQNILDSH